LTRFARQAIDAAKGLQYLHSRNPPVVHGDIKLVRFAKRDTQLIMADELRKLNVLINDQHHAVLSDFGLAKITSGLPSGLTTANFERIGTPHYQSPELVKASQPHRTTHSDIWAFGCLLFEVSCRVSTGAHAWSSH